MYMPDDYEKFLDTKKWKRCYAGHQALWRREFAQRAAPETEKATLSYTEYMREEELAAKLGVMRRLSASAAQLDVDLDTPLTAAP